MAAFALSIRTRWCDTVFDVGLVQEPGDVWISIGAAGEIRLSRDPRPDDVLIATHLGDEVLLRLLDVPYVIQRSTGEKQYGTSQDLWSAPLVSFGCGENASVLLHGHHVTMELVARARVTTLPKRRLRFDPASVRAFGFAFCLMTSFVLLANVLSPPTESIPDEVIVVRCRCGLRLSAIPPERSTPRATPRRSQRLRIVRPAGPPAHINAELRHALAGLVSNARERSRTTPDEPAGASLDRPSRR